jgi:hypothetical protein
MNLRLATTAAVLGLLTASPAMAAKPAPPPPSPPTSCSGAPGVFPAVAYTRDKYRTAKKFGGTQVYDGADLYLANSTGSCSILIYPGTRDSSAGSVSYRQIGTEARIVWPQGSEIRMLKFHVNDGSVVEPLPLVSSRIYLLDYAPSGINDVQLSSDGQTIYYTDEVETIDGRWIDTLNSISVANCSLNCPRTPLYTFPDDNGADGLSINGSDESRLYMSIHDRVPNIRTISFLEKQGGGVWTSLRHVVSNADPRYTDVTGFGSSAFGRWAHDADTDVEYDVVAFTVERSSGDTTEVIDVSNCLAASIAGESCLDSEDSTIVKSGIAGHDSHFTSTPSFGVGPHLLVKRGASMFDVDLDSQDGRLLFPEA